MQADPLDGSITEALRAWRMQHGAGLSLIETLENCGPLCRTDVGRKSFAAAAQSVKSGGGIEDVAGVLKPILSPVEGASIVAGWKSGRIETILDAIVEQREVWSLARSKVRSRLAMPVVVLIIASLVAPLPGFIQGGNAVLYILSAGAPLLVAFVLWRVISAFMQARAQSRNPATATLDRFILDAPLAGNAERARNVGEFAALMANLIEAGMTFSLGLETCSLALTNSLYRDAAIEFSRMVQGGEALSTALAKRPKLFPYEFVAAVQVGEKSGKLDNVLRRESRKFLDQYVRAVEALADWLPRILYALVALFVIIQIAILAMAIAATYRELGI